MANVWILINKQEMTQMVINRIAKFTEDGKLAQNEKNFASLDLFKVFADLIFLNIKGLLMAKPHSIIKVGEGEESVQADE